MATRRRQETVRGTARVRDRGQITIPVEVREAARLAEGDPVEIEMVPEGILLRPQKTIDSTQAWFWTAAWQKGEAEASDDLAAGRVTKLEKDEDFLGALE